VEEVGRGGEEEEDLPQQVVAEVGDGGGGRSHVAQYGREDRNVARLMNGNLAI
jgi:hypothetical protein